MGPIEPPISIFKTHFSCVRARDLKFVDFLSIVKVNLVKKIIFVATGLGNKIVKKWPYRFLGLNNSKKR